MLKKIKQRILERLNEAADKLVKANGNEEDKQEEDDEQSIENSEYNLDGKHRELLNLISNYVDFYDPNVDIKSDTRTKFTYAVHALNHALK
jgi:hypothetical protein